jgi:hypothetical protein
MYGHPIARLNVVPAIFALLMLAMPNAASAALEFFYDPASGNVAFDTAGSPTGRVGSYQFFLDTSSGIQFRAENHIRVSNSPFYSSEPHWISDDSDVDPLVGFYTIGDILPIGLDEHTWTTMFRPQWENDPEALGTYYYSDVLATDSFTDGPAEFVYGMPDRPFDNRLDLLDPDEIQWATSAVLRYRAFSGELLLDTTGPVGGYISSFGLESNGGFIDEAFTPPTDSPFVLQIPEQLALFAEVIEPGVYSLGRVLDAGLSQAEFEATFTSARFMTRAGYDFGSFDFEADGLDFALAYTIPEPSTAILLLLSAIAILCCRGGIVS